MPLSREAISTCLAWAQGRRFRTPSLCSAVSPRISGSVRPTCDEFERLRGLSGQARIAGAVAFARSLVDEQALVLPTGYPVFAFFVSERIGCGFVQPAIGAVDLLSLCVKDEAAAGSPSP